MRSSLLLAFALLATGCSKDVTKEIEGLADRACACKDAACADKVIDDLLELADKNRDAEGDKERTNAAAQKLGKCAIEAGIDQTKFMTKMKKLQEMDN